MQDNSFWLLPGNGLVTSGAGVTSAFSGRHDMQCLPGEERPLCAKQVLSSLMYSGLLALRVYAFWLQAHSPRQGSKASGDGTSSLLVFKLAATCYALLSAILLLLYAISFTRWTQTRTLVRCAQTRTPVRCAIQAAASRNFPLE